MEKYAFCFEHKIFSDVGQKENITEYFRPYSPEVLLEIVKSNSLKERLNHAIHTEQTFENFIERYNLQDSQYVRRLNKDELQEHSLWINDENDLSEISQWDYLADAKLIIETIRFGKNLIEKPNYLAPLTMISRLQFEHLKLIISILVYTDFPDFEEWQIHTSPLPELDSETRDLLLHLFREIDSEPYSDSEFIIDLCERYFQQEHSLSEKNNVTILIRQIYELYNAPSALLGSPEYKYHINRVKYLKKQFFSILGTKSLKRQVFIKNCLSLVNDNGKFVRKEKIVSMSDVQILEMCLGADSYYDFAGTLVEELITYPLYEKIITDYISLPHASDFTKMTNSFNQNIGKVLLGKVGHKIYDKYFSEGRGCFTILITAQNKKYFAFSGREELNSQKYHQMEELAKYIMKNAFNITSPITDIYAHTYEYNWAYLNNNTPRYTTILTSSNALSGNYISTPQTLSNDIVNKTINRNDLDTIGNTYGCCERKILGHISGTGISEIYSRWAPCWKCRPAILAIQPCDYYAYADLDSLKKGKDIGITLKKYTVTCTTTYGISTQ